MYQTAYQMESGRDVQFEDFMRLTSPCDECGKFSIEMHQTDGSVNLCPSCYAHFGSLPSTMKNSVEKWLMGNVL